MMLYHITQYRQKVHAKVHHTELLCHYITAPIHIDYRTVLSGHDH